MSNQLYINGKPASLFQRIVAIVLGVGALIIFAFFGLAVFVIGLGVTAVLAIYFLWKTRKVRRQLREEMRRAKERADQSYNAQSSTQGPKEGAGTGKLYEGEYKEL